MKYLTLSLVVSAAALLGGSSLCWASEPPAQYSAQDIVSQFAKPPAPKPASAAGAAAGACERKGMITGEDGICEPRKETRGFSLINSSSTAKSVQTVHAAQAARAAPAEAVRARHSGTRVASLSRTVPVSAASAETKRDLLIDFESGSARLTAQARANAHAFAQAMADPRLSGAKFEIEGHTDAVGPRDRNQALSEQRAEAVKQYLVSQGVDGARLQAKGYGFDKLALPSNPKAAANRRVEAHRID